MRAAQAGRSSFRLRRRAAEEAAVEHGDGDVAQASRRRRIHDPRVPGSIQRLGDGSREGRIRHRRAMPRPRVGTDAALSYDRSDRFVLRAPIMSSWADRLRRNRRQRDRASQGRGVIPVEVTQTPWHFTTWLDLLDHWQTGIAGGLAFAAGFGTVVATMIIARRQNRRLAQGSRRGYRRDPRADRRRSEAN